MLGKLQRKMEGDRSEEINVKDKNMSKAKICVED